MTKLRFLVAGLGAGLGLALAGAVPVLADGNGPVSCDSIHGVFGVFAHHNATVPEDPAGSATGTLPIPVDAREDRGLGHATGPAQAAAAQACQGQNKP
ncbi:MAG TPA: hypothetical protein VK131_14335 [Candidatus Acidoferrales bacterium]|nr:hypothetical protein [Candidatus Acidoferrales bacterium]